MRLSGLIRWVAVAALLTFLPAACGQAPAVPPDETISFTRDILPGRTVLSVQREDTDSDGQTEWVVFYRFDQVGERGPVAALIYDVVRDAVSQLPLVYPYRLRTPDQNYLAQTQPEVTLANMLPEASGTARNELIFRTDNELAFFQLTRDPSSQPSDDPPLYRCIGFFRSEGGVHFDPNTFTVTVTSGAGFERSQLVTKYYYRPQAEGYFIADTTTLVSPFASAVDFPERIPSDILDTPYPEKVVLAFYKTLGSPDPSPAPSDYLSQQAANQFAAGTLSYGSPFPQSQTKSAVVKELGYYPTQDDTMSTVVTVKVIFESQSGARSGLSEVRWTLTRVQGRWKMDYPQL